MKKVISSYPGIMFALQCAAAGGLIMFLCMAAGELLIEPDLFRGMLKTPKIWPLIFLESAIWLLPCMLLAIPLLRALRGFEAKTATSLVVAGWLAIGVAVIVGYKMTYYPTDWSLEQIQRPDITFGWTIPCILILFTFVLFSLQYLQRIRAKI